MSSAQQCLIRCQLLKWNVFISGLRVFLISDVMTMVYLYALIIKKKRNIHTNSDEILVKFDPIPNHEMTHTLCHPLNLITYEHHDDDDPP